MLWLKVGAGVAIILGAWWAFHTISGAFAERDELRLTTAEQSQTIARFEQHAKDETESAARLRAIDEKIDGNKEALIVAIKAGPLTRQVKHEVKDNAGNTQTFTCNERDAVRYLGLFNAAVEGRADATAPGVPDALPSQ